MIETILLLFLEYYVNFAVERARVFDALKSVASAAPLQDMIRFDVIYDKI